MRVSVRFEHSEFWLRRLHLQASAANGGGIIALIGLLNSQASSLLELRQHEILFVPFLLGLLCASISGYQAAKFGKYHDLIELAERQRKEQSTELTKIIEQAKSGELDYESAAGQMQKINQETQRRYNEADEYSKYALPAERRHIQLLIFSGLLFLCGVIMVAFGDVFWSILNHLVGAES